jgi:hypothetical protein
MKTTLEIPDAAAQRGIPLRQFVTEAVQEKLAAAKPADKPWIKAIGGLRHLHDENVRIQKLIDEEFEKIEPEMGIDHRHKCALRDRR